MNPVQILNGIILFTMVIVADAARAMVIINESFNPLFESGEFTVINNSSLDITAFFVANNDALQADKAAGPVLDSWRPAVITRGQWEAGTIPFPDVDPSGLPQLGIGPTIWTPPDTTLLNWDDLFGPGFDRAFGYWADGFAEITQQPVAAGTTQDGFLFYASAPASPWVAFGADGVVASGDTNDTVVPAPAAVWLFGTGLLGIVGLARRHK